MMYSEKFLKCMPTIFDHEGLFDNDPDDPGGATKYGISLRFLRSLGQLEWMDYDHDGDCDIDDIKGLTTDEATAIYWKFWYDKYGYENIPDFNLTKKLFDLSVNMGAGQNQLNLQKALMCCAEPELQINLTLDGILGPQSYRIITTLCNAGHADAILSSYRAMTWWFYENLISKKPVFVKYRNGWRNRALS